MNPTLLGTLRRPRIDAMTYDSTPPRILSKIDIDPQYYYGWHLQTHNNKLPSQTSETETIATLSQSSTKDKNPLIASKSIDTTHSISSPTSVHSIQQQQKQKTQDELSNKTTVVLCPPSRTYCF